MFTAAHEVEERRVANQRLPVWQAFFYGAKRHELTVQLKDINASCLPPPTDIDTLCSAVRSHWQNALLAGVTQAINYLPVVLPYRFSQGNGNKLFKKWMCGSGLGANVGKGSLGDCVKVHVEVTLPHGVSLSETETLDLQQHLQQHLIDIAIDRQAHILHDWVHADVAIGDVSSAVFVICPFNTLEEADRFSDSVNTQGTFQGHPLRATYNRNRPDVTRQAPER